MESDSARDFHADQPTGYIAKPLGKLLETQGISKETTSQTDFTAEGGEEWARAGNAQVRVSSIMCLHSLNLYCEETVMFANCLQVYCMQ